MEEVGVTDPQVSGVEWRLLISRLGAVDRVHPLSLCVRGRRRSFIWRQLLLMSQSVSPRARSSSSFGVKPTSRTCPRLVGKSSQLNSMNSVRVSVKTGPNSAALALARARASWLISTHSK